MPRQPPGNQCLRSNASADDRVPGTGLLTFAGLPTSAGLMACRDLLTFTEAKANIVLLEQLCVISKQPAWYTSTDRFPLFPDCTHYLINLF